jgi:hypothetical protein
VPSIIAYAYDADIHCPYCAEGEHGPLARGDVCATCGRYGSACAHGYEPNRALYDEHYVHPLSTDNDGNEVHPIFSTDEWCSEYDRAFGCWLECSDCRRTLEHHEPNVHGYCNCGDGCAEGECSACEPEEEEPEEDDGCRCSSCKDAETYALHERGACGGPAQCPYCADVLALTGPAEDAPADNVPVDAPADHGPAPAIRVPEDRPSTWTAATMARLCRRCGARWGRHYGYNCPDGTVDGWQG